MVALLEGFEVQTVHAGELGLGHALGPARDVRVVADGVDADVDARGFAADMHAADELGLTLAHAVHAARAGAERLVVRVALGNDFLLQVAKLRALRLCWARVGELAAVPELIVWAEPSAYTWTVYDPWVNLLRNTAGCFAAVVGGADWIAPRAFDAALGAPEPSSVRLAENTVHVLVHEGQLAWPGDPAAGSWALESWTAALAERAWAVLQQVEAVGVDAFDPTPLKATARTKRERVVKRLDGIIGTSTYPNLIEARPTRAGEGLTGERAALPFERLRAAVDAGPRPIVFLACIGPLAEHAVRAGWVRGLYEVAGVRVVSAAVKDPADAVAQYRESGAPVAVVCGADAAYVERGASFIAALRDAGARVVLAGRPKGVELPESVSAAPKLYAGMDVVAALTAELAAQGVKV